MRKRGKTRRQFIKFWNYFKSDEMLHKQFVRILYTQSLREFLMQVCLFSPIFPTIRRFDDNIFVRNFRLGRGSCVVYEYACFHSSQFHKVCFKTNRFLSVQQKFEKISSSKGQDLWEEIWKRFLLSSDSMLSHKNDDIHKRQATISLKNTNMPKRFEYILFAYLIGFYGVFSQRFLGFSGWAERIRRVDGW